jgi:hypothetical protein
MTNVAFDRNQTGCLTTPCRIEVLWFENWANPASSGTGYVDQIKASKVGPIGFMSGSGAGTRPQTPNNLNVR